MFQELAEKKHPWKWPVAAAGVLIFIALIQILRVNDRPREVPLSETFTPSGALVDGDLQIDAQGFHTSRIVLNRRTKLAGVFRTENVKSLVSVLVMDEKNFDNWKANIDYAAITQTGYVPGGRVGPVLEPGTYLLVIDNRRSDVPRKVRAEFSLE